MITGSQLRAARALLDWSQERLAVASGVTERTIRSVEDDRARPHDRTMTRLRKAVEAAGIEFIESETAIGVLVNRPSAER